MSISVIVPTLNEAQLLSACLASVRNQSVPAQLVVVDGGSRDGTQAIAHVQADAVIEMTAPGIAEQMNAGAFQATGDILVFLHADCQLTDGCLERIQTTCEQTGIIGGALTMLVQGNRYAYKILSVCGNAYCRLTGTLFGDRAMFIRRSVFESLHGFAPLPIMCDVELSHRMKRFGTTRLVPGPVLSSSRKFDQEPAWLSPLLILWALAAFRLGVPCERIRDRYYKSYADKPRREAPLK